MKGSRRSQLRGEDHILHTGLSWPGQALGRVRWDVSRCDSRLGLTNFFTSSTTTTNHYFFDMSKSEFQKPHTRFFYFHPPTLLDHAMHTASLPRMNMDWLVFCFFCISKSEHVLLCCPCSCYLVGFLSFLLWQFFCSSDTTRNMQRWWNGGADG